MNDTHLPETRKLTHLFSLTQEPRCLSFLRFREDSRGPSRWHLFSLWARKFPDSPSRLKVPVSTCPASLVARPTPNKWLSSLRRWSRPIRTLRRCYATRGMRARSSLLQQQLAAFSSTQAPHGRGGSVRILPVFICAGARGAESPDCVCPPVDMTRRLV